MPAKLKSLVKIYEIAHILQPFSEKWIKLKTVKNDNNRIIAKPSLNKMSKILSTVNMNQKYNLLYWTLKSILSLVAPLHNVTLRCAM